ncbi:vascular endothelial growth factor receptor 1-like [Ptychodera flava]|uniref:vascular endothelial growth factor receptor 1-like n=1 Tax=Ptychodera flava TaxID=63121 RepID=UPI00396A195C
MDKMAEVISSVRYCRMFCVFIVLVLPAFATFTLGSSSHQSIPQLSITEETTSIHHGDQLQITCRCNSEIEWDYPKHEDNDIYMRLEVVTREKTNANNEKDFTSILTVVNTTYLDTGKYQCKLKTARDRVNNQTATSVYVFVNSNETNQLLLPDTTMSFKVYAKWSFTIPCRLTNPSATILLRNRQHKIPVDGDTVQYDPTRGFVIKEGHPNYAGFIKCIARLNGQHQEVAYILFYEAIAPKPKPTIEGSKPEVLRGEHFRVTCKVDAPLSVTMNFKWEYPGQTSSDTADISHNSEDIYEARRSFRRFYSELKISEAELANEGYYNCTAVNYKGQTTVSTYVRVLDSGYLEIKPVKNQYVIEAAVGSKVKVAFEVRTYPKSSYMWYKDGAPIYSRNSTFEIRKKDNQRRLMINEVTLEHEGNYTLVGANEYIPAPVETTVQLIVIVPPQLRITQTPVPTRTNPPLYMTKEAYTLDCDVTGRPLPAVTWLWQPCSDLDDCKKSFSNSNQWISIPFRDADATPGFQYLDNSKAGRSSLSISAAVQPGWYRCVASSPAFPDNVTQDIEFKLTDVTNGLSISANPLPVIETMPVNLTCKANKYAYRNIRWSRKVDANTTADILQDLSGREVQIHESTTEYSHVSVLSIPALYQNDSGAYSCSVTNRRKELDDPDTTTLTHNFEVNAISRPTIKKGLMHQRILASKGRFNLECQAYGVPTPMITWYKDTNIIENNDIGIVQGDMFTSTLTVTRIDMYDTGMYTCRAGNQGGYVNSSALVEIYEKLNVVVEPAIVSAHQNDNVTLTCRSAGNPRPVVKWTKKFNATHFSTVPRHMYTIEHSRMYNVISQLILKEIKHQEMGSYRCVASNMKMRDSEYMYTDSADSIVQHSTNSLAQGSGQLPLSEEQIRMMALLGGGFAFVLIVFIVIIITLRKYRKRPTYHSDTKEMAFPPIIEDGIEAGVEGACEKTPYDKRWEFPIDHLRIGQTIGRGAFGRVVKAAAWGINGSSSVTTVAIKMLKVDANETEKKALWTELKMLIHIGQHLNIVNLLGACTTDCLYVIIEFCKHGNLCDYLRTRRDSFVLEPRTPSTSPSDQDMYDDVFEYMEDPLSLHDLTCFCFQVARGMEFLASKKVIHRDLAARNVLLGENHVVKICDFGLARDIYDDPNYITKGSCRLPIKWMAPESILDDKVFTTESDVWSFGILMWEIFSLGGTPYPGMQIDEEFFERLRGGYRMRCPELAPQEIYQVMMQCWSGTPKSRPSFSSLAAKLGSHLETNVRQEYIDLNEPYQNRNSTMINYADLVNEEVQEYQPLMSKNSYTHAKPNSSGSDTHSSRPYLEPITRRIKGSTVTTFPASENDAEEDYWDGATELSSLDRNRSSFNDKGSSKSEESVSSDMSSGFHSEGYANELKHAAQESDPPPEYSQVIEADSAFNVTA